MRQERSLGLFNKIVVEDGLELILAVGTANVAQLEAQANLLPYIETRIVGTALHVAIKDRTVFEGDVHIVIQLVAIGVDSITAGAGAKVLCANKIDNEVMYVNSSGGAEVQLQGRASNVEVVCSGGGKVGSFDFTCVDYLNIDVSGGGKAELTVSGLVDVLLSGGSSFAYQGQGTIQSANVLSGSVIKKE